MAMTLPALMMMMEVLWSWIVKRMQSLFFANWIVMTMDQNMIEALSLAAWQISSPETLGVLSPLLFFLPLSSLFPFCFQAFHPLPSSHSSVICPFLGFLWLLDSVQSHSTLPMTEREGPITELVNYPSSLFFLLFALRASILLPLFCITLLLVFSFFLYHFPSLIHFIPTPSITWFQ